ncbi:Bug family tripartite tricarboxylate transporter substrate binding protein, partial [Puniceibacterium confluentis]
MNLKLGIAFGVAAIAGMALSGVAQAQDTVADFYKDKTITLLISASPGGSSDFFGRQLAEHMGKFIPGNPTIVPVNKSGAGGMVAAVQLQNAEKTDGTVIGFLQRNNLYTSLLEGDSENFDPREMAWLGSMNRVFYTIVAWNTSPVQSFEEMFSKTMILGATGFSNENRTLPALINEYLGGKFKIIHGYTGSEEVGIAMERGEVDGKAATANNLTAGNEAEWIADGRLKVIFNMAWENPPEFPDLKNFNDTPMEDEVKSLINFLILPFDSGRPIAVSNKVPADRIAALRKAFDDTMADPEFIARMKELNSSLEPISGQRVDDIVK